MAETPNDNFYKRETLLKAFAISSMVMLVFTIWMVLDDYGREWKGYQREFAAIQQKKFQQLADEAKTKVDENKLKELEQGVAKADKDIAQKKKQTEGLQAEFVKLKTREK